MKDLVSIIVPMHNAEQYITKTIQSVLDQTYQNWELLLIDDCSIDHTLQVTAAFDDNRIVLVQQERNLGAAMARNRGIQMAQGRYLAYLDADDLWKPEKLEHQIAFMEKKQAAFSFTNYEFADENAVGTGKIVRVPTSLTYKQALSNTTIFTSTVMFDLTLIQKSLLEMPRVKSEDTASWWKILKNGYIAWGLEENLVTYRRPKKSLSSNKFEALLRIWNLYRKVEGLSVFTSCICFVLWAVRAVLRRI